MNKNTLTREMLAREILFHPEVYPGMIKRDSSELIFLIWRNDTLGDYITWSLFRSDNNKHYVRRVIWKQQTLYKLKEPHTFAAEYLITQELASYVIEGFLKLNFDDLYYESSNLTIDGIESGLKTASNSVSWQNTAPQKLAEWYEDTLDEFEKLFF